MNDKDTMQMMKRCRQEIQDLRAQIATLAPKAEAWDRMGQVLRMVPQQAQGYGEDVLWRLDTSLDALAKKMAEPVAETAQPPSHPYPEPEAAAPHKLPVRPYREEALTGPYDDVSLEDEAFLRADRNTERTGS